jgi:hypothetical protein
MNPTFGNARYTCPKFGYGFIYDVKIMYEGDADKNLKVT